MSLKKLKRASFVDGSADVAKNYVHIQLRKLAMTSEANQELLVFIEAFFKF